MQGHARFNYADSQSLRDDIQRFGLSIPFADPIDSLKNTLTIGRHQIVNRLATLPMEGCDGELDGTTFTTPVIVDTCTIRIQFTGPDYLFEDSME